MRAAAATVSTALLATVSRAVAEVPKLGAYVPPESHTVTPSPGSLILRMLASLVIVVGLLVVTAWLVRVRSGLPSGEHGARLKVIETAPLGPSRALYLVHVGGQVLLLGAAGQVTHLATFAPDQVGYDPEAAPTFDSFLARLQRSGRERTEAENVG